MNQSKLEAITCRRRKARENAQEQVAIGFGFTSDWLRNLRESFKPITKRSNTKPKQTQITFDSHVKIALFSILNAIIKGTMKTKKESFLSKSMNPNIVD